MRNRDSKKLDRLEEELGGNADNDLNDDSPDINDFSSDLSNNNRIFY
jgi:hypothetical protein